MKGIRKRALAEMAGVSSVSSSLRKNEMVDCHGGFKSQKYIENLMDVP